ncbi:MAG TPA: hypothetical protein VNX68_04915 [Nitrosopumilaceae archaeon]|jgi:hypothetical protein|nr:hypothetical protein [Nitrosopumilaceae archaeon]
MGNLYNFTSEEITTWSFNQMQSAVLAMQSYANKCEDEIIRLNHEMRKYYKLEQEQRSKHHG